MRARLSPATTLLFAVLFAVSLPLPQGRAASGPEIEASAHSTLGAFFRRVRDSRDLANKALAVLVFPTVVKAGIGVGGEYGEGELLIRGQPAGFYNIASASVGLQLGAQARSVIIMFMTEGALSQFQLTDGFKVGVDGSIAIVAIGAGGAIDTNSITKPVIGFIFDQKGLMYNLTLEGTKISRISR
ncbi:MAG: YSC84-related protein [Xanthobacteraceae bacterium]